MMNLWTASIAIGLSREWIDGASPRRVRHVAFLTLR